MLSTKRFCLLCANSVFNGRHCNSTSRILREFSSKKGNKNHPKIEVTAKNDFVTHQLNSSFATHLKRQQRLWNNVANEERRSLENRRTDYYFDENTGTIEQTRYHKTKTEKSERQNYDGKYPNSGKHTRSNQRAQNFANDEDELSENDSDDFSLEKLEPPNWEDMNLQAIKKGFYKSSTITENRSVEDIHEFYLRTNISINSDGPKPIFKFNELNDLSEGIIAEIERKRFLQCTPIQSQGIPIALSGENLIAVSQMSTGKTLAMVLSAIVHILNQIPLNSEQGPVAVILAFTKEMAEEIRQLADAFCRETNIKCTVLNSNRVKKPLKYKFHDVGELLVATPCHLYELLRTKSLTLNQCSQFSLYEADKMLDMCLEEEILQIESQIRPDCQQLIWSSSWTSELRQLIVGNYVRLSVGSSSVKVNLSESIKQIVKVSEEKRKKEVLLEIVSEIGTLKSLIFTDTPEKADRVANILRRNGYQSKSLHNQKSIVQRNEILSDFQDEKFQFLVLTDVAAKNVHFNVSNVVNFDMPLCIEDYVLRLSRAGSAEDGTSNSYSIVSEEDGDLIDDLIGILQQCKQEVDPALFILKAANADSDDEVAFAVPEGKGFKKYIIDNAQK